MKDSEFIELLNLYLDHEISAADAARLEAEVQSNADRRRIYQDYCRMQKACKILAQDFAEESPDTSDRKIVAFEEARHNTRRRGVSLYVGGTLAAAAACVALVLATRTHQPAGSNPSDVNPANVVATTTAPATTTPVTQPANAVATHRGIERQSLNAFSLRNAQPDTLALAGTAPNDPHLAWIQDVRLTPIQAPTPINQLELGTAANPRPENRTFSSSQPLPKDINWVAIRFQR